MLFRAIASSSFYPESSYCKLNPVMASHSNYWYEITSEKEWTLADFAFRMGELHPRLKEENALEIACGSLPEQTRLSVITFNYRSLDELGLPLTMSSLLVIPFAGGCFSAPRLVLENRATQAADKSVPTHQWNIGTVHALSNSVLVSPDLMSFGASVDRPICYCHGALAARNTVDAAIAAQTILMNRKLTDAPLPVYNTGHSQGGFDALAVHRYMETAATPEECRMLPLVKSYCASGPYAPDVLTEVVSPREKYLYGAYMVLNVMSYLHYRKDCLPAGLSVSDFLTPAARELGIEQLIACKEHSNTELVKTVVSALGTCTTALFIEDACKPGGHLYGILMEAYRKERQIDGWQPQKPIWFYHAKHDECVVVECMYAAREAFAGCPNVVFEEDEAAPDAMVHKYSGGAYHRRILLGNWF